MQNILIYIAFYPLFYYQEVIQSQEKEKKYI